MRTHNPDLVKRNAWNRRRLGLRRSDILAINARLEIIYSGDVISKADASEQASEGCTSAAALPEATSGGEH